MKKGIFSTGQLTVQHVHQQNVHLDRVRIVDVLVKNLLYLIVVATILAEERCLPGEHLVQHHTGSPNINLGATIHEHRLIEHLWWMVKGRPVVPAHLVVHGEEVNMLANTKVGQLDHIVVADQNVVRLDVPMDHCVGVQIIQSFHYLGKVAV